MTYGENFWQRKTVPEKEHFRLVGSLGKVVQLEPNRFEGPVALWANDRMRKFGDTIVPKLVLVHQPPNKKAHKVAWIYHEGINAEGLPFCAHHIACDCSGDVDSVETIEEKEEIMTSCTALGAALGRQADAVNHAYAIDTIMEGLHYDPECHLGDQNENVQDFAFRSIVKILEHDYRHPESWIANVESGWTITNLMAKVLRLRDEDVEWAVEQMSERGEIGVEGAVVGLTQRQMDEIEVEKRLNGLLEAA